MKKFIALFLSVCMCVSFMASVVYADETEDIPSTEQTTEETTVETTVETTEQTTVETEPESEPEVCTGEDQQSFNSDETAIEINETNFPDANFRDYVSTNFDSDSEGVLYISDIDNIESIIVDESSISSLKGIEYFTNLKILNCANNQLTTLDVSKNVNLTDLNCECNQLTTLDVSKNVNLEELICGSNKLTALDVSKNVNLEVLNCYDNQLTALDVSKNLNLEALNCYSNQLTKLDLSLNSEIKQYLLYYDEDVDVTLPTGSPIAIEINETNFPDAIFRTYVSTNFDSDSNGVLSSSEISNVKDIDVRRMSISSLKGIEYFTNLTTLDCSQNRFTTLDVSKNVNLGFLSCSLNRLTALDVSKNTNLYYLDCRYNPLTELDVRNNSISCLLKDDSVHVITNDCSISEEWSTDSDKHWHVCTCGKKQAEADHVYDNACDATCNVCGETRTPPHDYDNECDATCNACDETRMPPHDYDNACDADCNLCGVKRTPADHQYENACDADCNVCGAKRTPADHVFDNDSDADCNVCGGVRINETAFPDSGFRSYVKTNFDSNEDGVLSSSEINYVTFFNVDGCEFDSLQGIEYFTEITYLSCEGNNLRSLDVSKNTKLVYLFCSCNYITELDIRNLNLSYIEANDSVHLITKDHYYSEEWTTDSDKHWHECPCGKKIEEAEHVYGNACDIDCNVCGATRTVTHNYGSSWTTNGTSHWHQCSCGNKSDVAAHSLKTVTTAATTSAAGKTETKCSVCGKVTKNTVINAFGTVSLSYDVYTYNGKAHKPDVTVKDTVGNVISSSNYTVSYPSKCTNVGTYTIKITFKGDYSGTTTITYKIKPAKSSIKTLSSRSKGFYVKWSKVSKQISGYQIQYSTSSDFSSGTKTVNASWKSVSKTISKLKGKKKYYVRVRVYKTVNGVKYYSDWSSAKSITTKK